MPNALDLLKQDHEKVRKLLKELADSSHRATKTRKELLSKIHKELEVHTRLEEEIFYPAFNRANGKDHGELYHEAMEEHRIVENLVIPDVEVADIASDEFTGRAKVLRELVEHHADDEEKEMFAKARKAFSKEELEELGERMKTRKEELQRQGA